ncbi:hypothetical protein GPALN_003255 [Globodera pallida]|uniref:S-adenosyl-L-methionine-dependent methyltransferase n=1 Tax=Globodera pallida TaxID=36090 RepID=A0A183BJB2_GLOPA|nr:hypothetical protein GPALN_003255 [Globodera pallida]
MSDNESDEEQQQQIEKIFISADFWYGVFAFLDPFELGLKMALISDRLDVLVDVHFKSRKWSLGWMEIIRGTDGNGAEIVKRPGEQLLPIPQGPIPNKVTGFEGILLSYIDQTVIEFLQRIRRLFDSSGTNVWIDTDDDQSRSWEIIRQNIWPLVNDNICCLSLSFFQLDYFRRFTPAILRNCAKLRSIQTLLGFFPEFPAEDNAEASSDKALAKWLLTPPRGWPSEDSSLCFFKINFAMLRSRSISSSVPFELKNNWTGERLTFRQMDKDEWLLVRCPIGREKDKWTNWEKEAIKWNWSSQWNSIGINFEDRDIGDGIEPTG